MNPLISTPQDGASGSIKITTSEGSPFTLTMSRNFDVILNGKRFDPKDDMTPSESARFAQLFILMITQNVDAAYFVEKYNLTRHFTSP